MQKVREVVFFSYSSNIRQLSIEPMYSGTEIRHFRVVLPHDPCHLLYWQFGRIEHFFLMVLLGSEIMLRRLDDPAVISNTKLRIVQ